MATRRNRFNRDEDPFSETGGSSLQSVSDALFGADLQQADKDRVIVRPVELSEITVDQDIQVRVLGLKPDRIEMLVAVLLNGGEFKDPIELCRDDAGKLYLADGFHRYEAYRLALLDPRVISGEIKLAPLRARIRPGGHDAAINLSEDANLKHGEPLSTEDKRLIFKRRMQRGHEWANWSNPQIAAQLAVGETTIRRWRSSLTSPNGEVREDEGEKTPEKRFGKDGREIKIGGIQKAAQKRQKKQEKEGARGMLQPISMLELPGIIADRLIGALHQGELTWDELLRAAKRGLGQEIAPSLFNSVLRDMVRGGLIAPSENDQAAFALGTNADADRSRITQLAPGERPLPKLKTLPRATGEGDEADLEVETLRKGLEQIVSLNDALFQMGAERMDVIDIRRLFDEVQAAYFKLENIGRWLEIEVKE